MELQEKEAQKEQQTGNLFRKGLQLKRCLLILDLKPLRS